MLTDASERISRARIPGNLKLNATPSMRLGYYLREPLPWCVGSMVTVPLIAAMGEKLAAELFASTNNLVGLAADTFAKAPADWDMIKRVAAAHGDEVHVEGNDVRINGVLSGKRYPQRVASRLAGATLPFWEGRRRLRKDEVFLLGDGADGVDSRMCLDGRYMGSISARLITAAWTFFEADELEALRKATPALVRADHPESDKPIFQFRSCTTTARVGSSHSPAWRTPGDVVVYSI